MCYCIIYYFAKVKKIRLKPIAGGIFFVFENIWSVKNCYFGGVPGGELCWVVADYCYQVVVTLWVNLDVRDELEFVRLQGTDDLGFEIVSSTALGDDVLSEYGHLFVGEVCISKNVLNFYEMFVQLLVAVPDMFTDGEAAAEV